MSLTKIELIYSNPEALVSVWKCFDESLGTLVALKERGFRTVQQAEEALRQYRIQQSLSHPNICRVVSYYQETRESVTYNVVALEWMDKQDLFKVIKDRKHTSTPWSENQLWACSRELVSALAMAQQKGISHRDVKPQNVLVNSNDDIKIGDFGLAKSASTSGTHTLVGTSYFLSPLLRAAFASGNQSQRVFHNPFKSDVYSLGVTLLFMAVMQTPLVMGATASETALSQVVQSIPYSDTLKSMLGWMLATEEQHRPDFIQLDEWLSPQAQVPPQVKQECRVREGVLMKCPTCYLVFPFTNAVWTGSLQGFVNYCSIDCYLIMKGAFEHQHATETLCLACRKWSFNPMLFDCGVHGVCSTFCGRAVIINTSHLLRIPIKCPECETPLGSSQFGTFFWASEKMKEKLENLMCEDCREVLADRLYFTCGHAICDGCYYKNVLATSGYFLCPHPSQCWTPYISRYE